MVHHTIYRMRTKNHTKHKYITAKSYSWENIGSFYQEHNIWMYSSHVFKGWGKEVELAKANMSRLVDLCKKNDIKITLVVYPWPKQIKQKDLNNKQVKIWQESSPLCRVTF